MNKFHIVFSLVEVAYKQTQQPFAQWMWRNHVPIVAEQAEKLGLKYGANLELAVAGALLHDYGDVFVHRHAENHDQISKRESTLVLQQSGYSIEEIRIVLDEIIAPHSCKDGYMPHTLEGKILATADAIAHLTTDFYLQFAWMHLPEGKTYSEFVTWAENKIDRDFNDKIFFDEVRTDVLSRYESLKEIFSIFKK